MKYLTSLVQLLVDDNVAAKGSPGLICTTRTYAHCETYSCNKCVFQANSNAIDIIHIIIRDKDHEIYSNIDTDVKSE